MLSIWKKIYRYYILYLFIYPLFLSKLSCNKSPLLFQPLFQRGLEYAECILLQRDKTTSSPRKKIKGYPEYVLNHIL